MLEHYEGKHHYSVIRICSESKRSPGREGRINPDKFFSRLYDASMFNNYASLFRALRALLCSFYRADRLYMQFVAPVLQLFGVAASYQSPQGTQGESDPNNTTIFVGGLDPNVTDDHLRQVFSQYGDVVHVKIPVGKRCGFVQFSDRSCAEQALSNLNGTMLGGQNVRLSWGRSPSNKQDQNQWGSGGGGGGGAYYGYSQGHEVQGGFAPPQDPNMYYGGYPGYANYQQPQQ